MPISQVKRQCVQSGGLTESSAKLKRFYEISKFFWILFKIICKNNKTIANTSNICITEK